MGRSFRESLTQICSRQVGPCKSAFIQAELQSQELQYAKQAFRITWQLLMQSDNDGRYRTSQKVAYT